MKNLINYPVVDVHWLLMQTFKLSYILLCLINLTFCFQVFSDEQFSNPWVRGRLHHETVYGLSLVHTSHVTWILASHWSSERLALSWNSLQLCLNRQTDFCFRKIWFSVLWFYETKSKLPLENGWWNHWQHFSRSSWRSSKTNQQGTIILSLLTPS